MKRFGEKSVLAWIQGYLHENLLPRVPSVCFPNGCQTSYKQKINSTTISRCFASPPRLYIHIQWTHGHNLAASCASGCQVSFPIAGKNCAQIWKDRVGWVGAGTERLGS